MHVRTGIGYDIHRTDATRPLKLAGIAIESPFGLAGHSDADVVLHAIADALLGAAALGDIGELFPDTDPSFKDADSGVLLGEVCERVRGAGWVIANVDVVVHAEAPKLKAHKAAMRASVAALLGIGADAVGMKATTNERLGEIGRGEAIACFAVATLERA